MSTKQTPAPVASAAAAREAATKADTKRSQGKPQHVVATRTGYYGERRRREGDRFLITLAAGEKLPTWVVTVEEHKKRQEQAELAALEADA